MAWFDQLPLDYSESSTKNALRLLKQVYGDPKHLKQITKLAGLDASMIDFQEPPALLPMEIMDLAVSQGRMPEFLAEVLVNSSVAGIHQDLWKLLGGDAERVHRAALSSRADFDRVAALPSPATYSLNGSEGDLQKIVNALAKFQDTAVFRLELAKREARVLRIELSGRGEGTGWLVAPDLVITACHVVEKAFDDWGAVRARLDFKIVPELERRVLEPGRLVGLSSEPLLAHCGHAIRTLELSELGADPSMLDFALLKLAEPVGSQGLGLNGKGDEQRGWFELPTGAHSFDPHEGLLVLGHPQLSGDSEAGPMKLTFALPSEARLTLKENRVRYSVNTEGGSSGSPVMDQDFRPLALHQAGQEGQPAWDKTGQWTKGFNQGIPLHLIVAAIRKQAKPETLAALNLLH